MRILATTLRFLLLLALGTGLLLPKMTAALAELSPNVWVIVICSGTSMETITLNANGDPVTDPELIAEHCLTTSEPPYGARDFVLVQQLLWDHAHAFSVQERRLRHDLTAHPPIPRGPPVSI